MAMSAIEPRTTEEAFLSLQTKLRLSVSEDEETQVLISYATGHRPNFDADGTGPGAMLAGELSVRLTEAGIPTYTGLHTKPGDNWRQFEVKMVGNFAECKILLCILTPAFYVSSACLEEVDLAIDAGVHIIPLRYDTSVPPSRYEQWSYITKKSPKEQKLMHTKVTQRLAKLNYHPQVGTMESHQSEETLIAIVKEELNIIGRKEDAPSGMARDTKKVNHGSKETAKYEVITKKSPVKEKLNVIGRKEDAPSGMARDTKKVNHGSKEIVETSWTEGQYKALLDRHTIDGMLTLDFSEGELKGFTAERAIELANHLPPTVQVLWIRYADFGKEFVEAVVDCVERSTNMTLLDLRGTKAGGGEGQQVGERLAYVMASNNTITYLDLCYTDLIGPDNVGEWGEALMANTTITGLDMDEGVEMDALEKRTKGRKPKLTIW